MFHKSTFPYIVGIFRPMFGFYIKRNLNVDYQNVCIFSLLYEAMLRKREPKFSRRSSQKSDALRANVLQDFAVTLYSF